MAAWLGAVAPKWLRPALGLAPRPRGRRSTWTSDYAARRTWDPVRGLELLVEFQRDATEFRILWRQKAVIGFAANVVRLDPLNPDKIDKASRLRWPDRVEWDVFRDQGIALIDRSERRRTIIDALTSYQSSHGMLRIEGDQLVRGDVVVNFDRPFVGR